MHDLDGSLARLVALRGVTFEYIDAESINERPGVQIGMIAQEVEQVFPDWVTVGGHGYKTLTFRGFEALTVEALRELRREKDAEVAQLKLALAVREADIARLRRDVEDLRAMAQALAAVSPASQR